MTKVEILSALTHPEAGKPARPGALVVDAGTALLAVLMAFAVYALQGLPTLTDANGDNDSLLRLVEVRDLLAGQGWFDLHQYRMGPPGGFVMHWSRLVDAPLALLMLLARTFGAGQEAAATFARLVWPLGLFGLALFIILRTVRELADEWAILPSALVAGIALYATGCFLPGNIDHHGLQLVLTLAMLLFLSRRAQGFANGAAAGSLAACMMAVGMETLPYVAAAGTITALGTAFSGAAQRRLAAGFGAGLCGISLAVMAATVAPSQWLAPRCDAFSIAQFAAAMIAGAGLVLAALAPLSGRARMQRLLILAIVGIVLATAVAVLFPQCLADPYAALDPRLREIWLDRIAEAQPVTKVFAGQPVLGVTSFATPFIALAVIAYALLRRRPCARWLPVTAVLAAAFAVSLWQLRGAMFSLPIAAIVLGAWIGRQRAAAAAGASRTRQMAALMAWVVATPLAWSVAAAGVTNMFPSVQNGKTTEAEISACYKGADYGKLAALPAATIMAPSNLGAAILRYTGHRVFAGPYHRDTVGLELAFDTFMASSDQAERLIRQNHATFVAICPGNAESGMLAASAPDGFMAQLLKGRVPAWLDPVDASGALQIYRVKPAESATVR